MKLATTIATVLVVVAPCRNPAVAAEADPLDAMGSQPVQTARDTRLTPPPGDGPVVVRAAFHLLDVNAINDDTETFEFTGVLTLTWQDKRQAFDSAEAGTDEKIYQGDYQFNEISTAWYPQVTLANASGLYEKYGTLLRVKPDGTHTLVETINAVAETELNLRRYPYDRQRLEAIFEVLGFDASEVVLEAEPVPVDAGEKIRIPQWRLSGLGASTRNIEAPYAGRQGVSSAFVLTVDAHRHRFFMIRLVVLPLALIVMLSWSVFWMERSSLGDRMSVSFVGILTAVAYQLLVSDILPQISYVTLIHGFLNFSFWIMCITVVINLVVGACDKHGKPELGDRIDRCCRWAFPVAYGILLMVNAAVMIFFF